MAGDSADDLRLTFDRSVAIYHDARPAYPGPIFDRLIELLPSPPSIVEVGPGSGHGTAPLLERGATVQAVEIGPELASDLHRRLERFVDAGQLEVVVDDFEAIEPPPQRFDAVVSVTAYHWISREQQLTLPRRWLAPAGRLAVVDTMQVSSPADGGYFDEAQAIYIRYGQASGNPKHDPDTVVPPIYEKMSVNDACVDVTLDRCGWNQTYSAAEYRRLLNTYSGTLAMNEPERSRMVDELVALVDELGGVLTRPLVITLATCAFGD